MSNHGRRTTGVLLMLAVLFAVSFWAARQGSQSDEPGQTAFGRIVRAVRHTLHLDGSKSADSKSKKKKGSSGSKSSKKKSTKTSSKDPLLSCSICGTVTNEDKQPIKDAKILVRARGTGGFQKTFPTNTKGAYQATGIPLGTYDIIAQHPLYVSLIRPSFTLRSVKDAPQLDFCMPLGTTLNLQISDEDKVPVQGVQVRAQKYKMEQFSKVNQFYLDDTTFKTEQSDAAGKAVVRGLALGDTILEFRKPGYALERKRVEIKAQAGREPLKITMRKTGRIAGIVLNENRDPVGTATVCLTHYRSIGGEAKPVAKDKHTTTTDAQGNFILPKLFDEGFYDMQIIHPSYATGRFPQVPAGSEGLTCILERGGIIEGQAVLIDRPTTPAGVLLAARAVVNGTTVTEHTKPAEDTGHFRFEHLPYGSYEIYADEDPYASEPKAGVPSLKDKPTTGVLIEVYQAATVRGQVVDVESDLPVALPSVDIDATYGPNQTKSRRFKAKGDDQGRFVFPKLPSGFHIASASATGYLKSTKGISAQAFNLTPGEQKDDLILKLGHGGTVEGYVTDAGGQPLEKCNVQLFLPSTRLATLNTKPLTTLTGAGGYFVIRGFEIGERLQLYASATKQGYAKTRSSIIELDSKHPSAQTRIAMGAGGVVSGKVTADSDKRPLGGVTITFTSREFPGDPVPLTLKASTDAQGSYYVSCCTPGSARLDVKMPGYITQSKTVTIRDAKVTTANFKLVYGQRITGKVESYEGKPVAAAKVRAVALQGSTGTDSTTTDKKGEFVLSGLSKGRFRVEASFPLVTPEGPQSYTFILPQVISGSEYADVLCDIDNTANGRVEGEKGAALNKFVVTLNSRTDIQPDQDFRFRLTRSVNLSRGRLRLSNIPRGIYTLDVSAPGYQPYHDENATIGPHKNTELPRIRLRPAGQITGVLLSRTTDRPVNNVLVRVLDPNKPETIDVNRVQLRNYRSEDIVEILAPDYFDYPDQWQGGDYTVVARVRNSAMASARSDYSGHFTLDSLPPGVYTVEFEHRNYMSLRLDEIAVSQANQTDLDRIYLEPGGTIQGQVTDGAGTPLSYASVRISGLFPDKRTSTDAGGNYIIDGIRSGSWPVVVRATAAGRKVYTYANVALAPDDTQVVDFHLYTDADLQGTLSGYDGAARPDKVRLYPLDENGSVVDDITYDASLSGANYSLLQVLPGSYFLLSYGKGASGGAYTLGQVVTLGHGTNPVALELGSAQVRGKVLSSSGVALGSTKLQMLPSVQSPGLSQTVYNLLIPKVTSAKSGTFAFRYLTPGTWQMLYQGVPGSSVAGQWMALDLFNLSPGQSVSYNITPAP